MTDSLRLILTGESGCGKTSVCRVVADELRSRGWRVGGLTCPGVWTGDQKVAIDALDLRSGEVRRLAERAGMGSEAVGPATPGWRFHVETLVWCNSLFANVGNPDLLVVDELGPLEFEQDEGLMQGMRAAEAGCFGMALLVVRLGLLPAAQARWPDARALAMHGLADVAVRAEEVLGMADASRASRRQAIQQPEVPDG